MEKSNYKQIKLVGHSSNVQCVIKMRISKWFSSEARIVKWIIRAEIEEKMNCGKG